MVVHRRPRALVLTLGLCAGVLAAGCSGPGTPDPEPTAEESPGGAALRWGVFVPDDGSPSSDLRTVALMAGDEPDYVLRFGAIDEPVPLDRLDAIADAGMTPVLTLEPWVPGAGTDQPAYSLARIAAGDHDPALERWARELAAWDRPLLLRFAHEMNGDWYPWSTRTNGGSAGDYVAAWRHVHDVFDAAGADGVQLVWAPNVPVGGVPGFEDAYPGPELVDVLGLDAYNFGDGEGHVWRDPGELLDEGLAALRRLDGDLPILVTETASAEGATPGADKAAWIRELVRNLERADRVVGFVWFQADKERDWRFNSTAEAEAAFRESLAG